MKFYLSKVEFSKNNIELYIKIPKYLDEDLAYFLGFHVGDSYMKIKKRGKTVDYHLQYDGHHLNDHLWYVNYLKPSVKRLFNKEINIQLTTNGTVRMGFRSKAIIGFLYHC